MAGQKKDNAKRYLANWEDERNGAALYFKLSEVEKNPQLKEIYRRMGEAEERHSAFWEAKMRRSGQAVPAKPRLTFRTRLLGWLAGRFGPQFVLPTISTLEQMDTTSYDSQPDAAGAGLPAQEQSHARLLAAITGGSKSSGVEGSTLAQLEGRHRTTGGNALRAAVLGADDGLVSNLSLVMGVAGADLAGKAVLITGLAGLLAGACSMALGEWLSVQSAREFYQRQIAVEKEEILEVPDEEAEELALIYQAKGLPADEAASLAQRLIGDKANALDTLSREELGIDPRELGGSPWAAGATSFMLFAVGAIFPVFPYFFTSGWLAVGLSLLLSAFALFGIGAGITLLTGRGLLYSGVRQVIFGLLAAAITFGIGRLIGVAVS
ncbi:MAG: VIT1/CCC1 transporter family protein [Chloroflexi bacterium]|nr:VIT1/CCC1 transporter family protein [Chloroflexota bacterium]OJV96297.1 MAG: rubrerythrin family protein [Chloroflexi bacterium 54-19]